MTAKRLYRSRNNAMIGGVCAGLAEYLDMDASLVRLATVILVFPGGLSFWVYIIAWIVMPQKPLVSTSATSDGQVHAEPQSENIATDTNIPQEQAEDRKYKTRMVFGIVLVGLGFMFLLGTFHIFSWFSFMKLWPIVLIIIGLAVLYKALNKGGGDES